MYQMWFAVQHGTELECHKKSKHILTNTDQNKLIHARMCVWNFR